MRAYLRRHLPSRTPLQIDLKGNGTIDEKEYTEGLVRPNVPANAAAKLAASVFRNGLPHDPPPVAALLL